MSPVARLAAAFALTVLVEVAVLAATARRPFAQIAWAGLLVNLLTNPVANAAAIELGASPWLIEALVVFVEAPLYGVLFKLSVRGAILAAVAANAASALLGVALRGYL